jgi:hypothetical protein
MTPKETVKTKEQPPQVKHLCHVHDKCDDYARQSIRQSVCRDLETTEHTDGKQYCLLHLPTKDKDIAKFEQIFKERLHEHDESIAIPDNKDAQVIVKREQEIDYDFRYVWFPSDSRFDHHNFKADANFSNAIFNGAASFYSCVFSRNARFTSVFFEAEADFSYVTFNSITEFYLARFKGDTSFSSTKFSKNIRTNFGKSTFTKVAIFDFAEFNHNVLFNSAIFGSDSDILFQKTLFAGKTYFKYCTAEGYLRFSKLKQSEENKFDFEDATFDKATRVSFHTLRLCPNWFVNVDSRKFVFTDVTWDNLSSDYRNKNIERELESLQVRAIDEQKKRLLEIAARQLAVNAEENNRYEEAAKFRYMAMETKRLEETKQLSFSRFLIWLYKWTSGYGENWTLAALVLIGVLVFYGYLYASPLSAFDYGKDGKPPSADTVAQNLCDKVRIIGDPQMNVCEGILHSLSVATFQRPEPKPNDVLTKLFIVLEVIFAPLQAALLALAIRRKFMR